MDNETTNKQTTSTTAEASTTTAQTQPTSITASQTAPITSIAPTANTNPVSPGTTLPDGYLVNGSMLDADGVMLPEYLGEYAEKNARSLKPLSASSFQRAFLAKAREANKKKVPYSAKKNCAQGMMIAALKQVSRKKDPAPRVLLDMIRAATATVVDDATFEALYMHLDAICTYMME